VEAENKGAAFLKVLFISANTEKVNMPTLPFGLGCIAEAARQAGHEIQMLDLMGETNPLPVLQEAICEFHPEVIGISVRNIDDQRMEDTKFMLDKARATVMECKRLSPAPVVIGGAGYSIVPVAALEYLGADMGIQGEGEASFLKLLGCLCEKAGVEGIPGLYLRGKGLQGEREFVENLDDLPLPGPDLWRGSFARDPAVWMPIQTRRGCSMEQLLFDRHGRRQETQEPFRCPGH